MKFTHLLVPCFLALLFGACGSTPEGRIMGSGEEDLVGAKRAGTAEYDRLIEGTLTKMMARYSERSGGTGLAKQRVGFVALENASGEPLGEMFDQIYELIDTSVNNHERFRMISKRFVDAALNEMGKPSYDKLFIPNGRRQFASILEQQGAPIEAMLYAKITSGETKGEDGYRQVNYMLTMELVDVATGDYQKDSCRISKEYTK
ncbi:MAG: hypothetical protein JNM84_13825 [Planctomycetes bacterium]|nr:hypothetical protein [Planctomycetota bacterium]